jgi:general secretion pathway protein H
MASLSALCPDVRLHPRAHSGQSGFTLIEIIVVITILTLVGGLVLTRQPWHSAGLDTDATLRALMNAMRLARSRAIAQDREVAVVTAPNGFSVDGTAPRMLPPDQALSPSRVVFTPDGGSTGGTILLLAGQRRIVVDVNWLTGRVGARETASP